MRRRAFLITAALLVACTGPVEPAGPGRLLVTGENGGVHLVHPENGNRTSLSEERLHPGPVQATSNGEMVVWTAVADDRPVVRIHQDGAFRDVEVPTFPFFYSFDAGASTLAALGNDPDGDGVALILVDLEAGDARVADTDRPYYLDWHPAEPLLAVHVGFRELAVLEDGQRNSLPVDTGDFQAPAWTSDGRLVAVRRTEGAAVSLSGQADGGELVVVDVSDGSQQPVASAVGPVPFDVAGDRVAYVEGGAGPLRVAGLDGGNDVEVSSGLVVAFEWSPDGELLLFHVLGEDIGLTPHVWDGEETVAYPSFQPTDTFVTEYLPFWPQYSRTITQWAPDGRAFAYAEREATVWIQPREGERHRAGPGAMVTWVP